MADEERQQEIEEIKKLPPRERLERLRQITAREQRKRKEAEEELTETERLIQETESELRQAPQQETELDSVVSEEEGLEEIAGEAPQAEEETKVEYLRQLDYRGLGQQFEYLTSTLEEEGTLTETQATDLYSVVQEARTRRQAMQKGTYKPTGEQVADQFKEIETTWEKIRKYIR